MRFVFLCAVALLTAVAPANAEEAQSPPPPAEGQTAAPPAQPAEASPPAAPAEDPNEVICKKLPSETGTRLNRSRKECHTRREWAQIAEESKSTTESAQSKN
ncbi:MAG: hypothetical protein ACKVRO_04345 [Micropepsaceae bacterium]